ncbi:MAG: hypothetical protein KUG78_14265 [Kangiellaceae bacterium]|nr:hypothetical protein [Kangiellaceae bacterium]
MSLDNEQLQDSEVQPPQRRQGYFLSTSSEIDYSTESNFLVASANFIFNHWKLGLTCLHHVNFDESDIQDIKEDGHHDGASDFSFDEYILVGKLSSLKSWQLNAIDSLVELFGSEFYQQLKGGLFSTESKLYQAVISSSNDSTATDFVRTIGKDSCQTWQSVPIDRVELKSKLLNLKLISEQTIARIYRPNVNWKELSTEKASRIKFIREFSMSPPIDFEFVSSHFHFDNFPNEKKLRLRLAIWRLLDNQEWQQGLRTEDRLEFPKEMLIYLLRFESLNSILAVINSDNTDLYTTSNKNNTLMFLLDRLVAHKSDEGIDALKQRESSFTAKLQMRLVSSLYACSLNNDVASELAVKFCSDKAIDKTLKWQQENQRNLEQLVVNGFSFSVEKFLSENSVEVDILSKLALKAAEKGYSRILMLLAEHGADLSYWSNFVVKYANKFDYTAMKEWLIEQEIEDLHFE